MEAGRPAEDHPNSRWGWVLEKVGENAFYVVLLLLAIIALGLGLERVLPHVPKLTLGQWLFSGAVYLAGGVLGWSCASVRHRRALTELALKQESNANAAISTMRAELRPDAAPDTAGGFVATAAARVSHEASALKEWAQPWIERAERLARGLDVEELRRKGLLLEPSDYARFVRNAEEELFHGATPRSHCERVRLLGSMVGFSFLLPPVLADLACESDTRLKTIQVLYAVPPSKRMQAWFALFFLTRTLKGLWQCENLKKTRLNAPLEIELRHSHIDFLAAALLMDKEGDDAHEPGRMAVLQSLSPSRFAAILRGLRDPRSEDRFHRGFRYDNSPSEADAFSVYLSAFEGLWQHFSASAQSWRCKFGAEGMSIEIRGPGYWLIQKRNGSFAVELSQHPDSQLELALNPAETRKLLTALETTIPDKSNDIKTTCQMIEGDPELRTLTRDFYPADSHTCNRP